MAIKVLMLGPDRRVHGGISGVVNNLYDAGIDKSVSVRYLATMKEGSKLRKALVACVAYLKFVACVSDYDVIHVNMASDFSYLRKAWFIRKAYKKGKKIVLHQHGGDWLGYYNTLNTRQRQRVVQVFNMANRVLVLSPYYLDFFKNVVKIESKIDLFPNKIAIPDEVSRVEHEGINILFLGRICKAKGVDELIDAVAKVREKFPKINLRLAGIYEDTSFEDKIEKNSDFITYLGWVGDKDKDEELRKCDIFVLPSYFEGQGVSVLEAMVYGCPVIATNVGGIPMMIDDHETGLLVEAKSSEAISKAIYEILTDDTLRNEIKIRARSKIEREFDIKDVVEKLTSIYEEVIGTGIDD